MRVQRRPEKWAPSWQVKLMLFGGCVFWVTLAWLFFTP